MMPRLCLIAAAAKNNVIGDHGKLPWKIPADLRYFKAVTLGKPVIMGRKTWDSIGGKPLPGRLNIVISRDPDLYLETAEVYHSFHAAIRRAEWWAEERNISEVMLIGGGDLYQQGLPYAHKVYLTRVDLEASGDAHFPELDSRLWKCSSTAPVEAQEDTPAHDYQVWELKRPSLPH